MPVPNATVLNAFWHSLRAILAREGWDVQPGKLTLENPLPAEQQVVVVIGMSGRLQGALQWRMPFATAQSLGIKLAGNTGNFDELQMSGLAELMNMVLGQTLIRLEAIHLVGRPAPPVVLLGNSKLVTPGFPVLHLPLSVDGAASVLTFAFQVEGALQQEAATGQLEEPS